MAVNDHLHARKVNGSASEASFWVFHQGAGRMDFHGTFLSPRAAEEGPGSNMNLSAFAKVMRDGFRSDPFVLCPAYRTFVKRSDIRLSEFAYKSHLDDCEMKVGWSTRDITRNSGGGDPGTILPAGFGNKPRVIPSRAMSILVDGENGPENDLPVDEDVFDLERLLEPAIRAEEFSFEPG